jgi:exopolysaccharide biosynthesis protein
MNDPRGSTRGAGVRVVAVTVLVVATIVVAASTAAPISKVTSAASLTAVASSDENGLSISTMSGAQFGVYTPIHVLSFNESQYALQIGLANHAINGGEQTPSSMCQATASCVAAVNGDFYDVSDPDEPVVGDEVGGIIRNCVLLHTPETPHEQADLDSEAVSNSFNWSSAVDVNGTAVPITAINQELPMSYLGVNDRLSGTLLYTSLYALRTPTAPGRVEYEFSQVNTASPTTINSTAELKYLGKTPKAVKVAPGRVSISAPTGTALGTLQIGTTVTLTTTSTAGCNNIGGHPILLDDGVVGPINRADTYMAMPSARTVIGWTSSGETVIMTVGGTDAKTGATMYQLVTMLLSLGVTTALDLDGGESTTLYADGRVMYPSAKAERAVSTGLLIVQNQSQ